MFLILDTVRVQTLDHGGSGATESGAILINGWRVKKGQGGSGRSETRFDYKTHRLPVTEFEAEALRKVTRKRALSNQDKLELLLFARLDPRYDRIHEKWITVMNERGEDQRIRSNGVRIESR